MTINLYMIRCLASGKGYVGITSKSIRARFKAHRREATLAAQGKVRGTRQLVRAINKYGAGQFIIGLLDTAATWDEGMVLEQKYIALHGTYGSGGMNETRGGEGAVGYRLTGEQRAAISVREKARMTDPRVREALGEKVRAAFATPEGRAAHQRAMKKRSNNPGWRAKAGRHQRTEETNRKKSEAERRRMADPAAREHLSRKAQEQFASAAAREQHAKRMREINADPERRARIAARVAALWADPEYAARQRASRLGRKVGVNKRKIARENAMAPL
jgi:hypothetical protein